MTKIKISTLIILILALIFSFASCGECTSHTDADKNGKCDNCGAAVEVVCDEHSDSDNDGKCDACGATTDVGSSNSDSKDVVLIEKGEAKFRLVTGENVSSDLRAAIDSFIDRMRELNIKFDVVSDSEDPTDSVIEILVGPTKTRGDDCYVDMYKLGPEGYVIKNVGKKVIIVGGTTETTTETFNKFVKDYIGLDEETETIDTVKISSKKWKESIQKNYQIKSITVKGEPINDYTIAVNMSDAVYLEAAKKFQSAIYLRSGIWLTIVDDGEASEKSVVVRHVEKSKSNEKGFKVYVDEKNLMIDCAYDNKLVEAMEAFVAKILYASGEFKFGANYVFDYEISKVRYEDFGAVGDGIADDYLAIKAAHDFANECGQMVLGKAGATYRIISTLCEDGVYRSIKIKTDTNWSGAKFIFDDTNVGWSPDLVGSNHNYSTNIFSIESDYSDISLNQNNNEYIKAINESGGLNYNTQKLDLGLGYPAMLTIYNNSHKCYIRYGGNENAGGNQLEIILIDAEGNIDPSTPFLFEYSKLTSVTVHRIDVTPITVQNAVVESLGSKVNLVTEYKSISRGINVTRPNVTIRNLEHIITGEIPKYAVVDKDSNILEGYTRQSDGTIIDPNGKVVTDGSAIGFIGHSYGGFINVSKTHNTYIEGVIFQARMYYLQGTYDLGVGTANATYFKNCSQSNFFTNKNGVDVPNSGGNPCWGVSGTNYCKNFTFDGCKLARYDAHCGVYNGAIINSEVADVTLIGGGEMRIENTVIYRSSGAVITLRSDYGATFKGTITFKDVKVIDVYENGNITAVVSASSANHYFGYTTYFPNIIIDNLYIRNVDGKSIPIASNSGFTPKADGDVYRGVLDPGIHKTDIDYPDLKCDVCEEGQAGHVENHAFKGSGKCDICGISSSLHKAAHAFSDSKNLNPYTPPSFIKVSNMDNQKFTLYVQDVPFFENTELEGISKVTIN